MIIQHGMATMETLSSTNLYPHTAKNNTRIAYWHVLQVFPLPLQGTSKGDTANSDHHSKESRRKA